jgi:probable addiction module antidote protein
MKRRKGRPKAIPPLTPRSASQHLDTALQKGDRPSFLLALREVVEASGGMSRVSRRSHLSRESLYAMLSRTGNPEIKSVWSLLKALGLRFCVTVRNKDGLSGRERPAANAAPLSYPSEGRYA